MTAGPNSPPTPGGMHREESLPMGDIQKLLEHDAIERREIILNFCKEVNCFNFFFICKIMNSLKGLALKVLTFALPLLSLSPLYLLILFT